MDRWTRRAGVSKLLRTGTRGKLAGQATARAPLERAYALAREPTPLHAPWPALTAYRLAHALLAQPAHAAPLGRITELFAEATAFGHLGPWPHVFRLATLHRSDVPQAEQQAAFAQAFSAYRAWVSRQQRDPDPGLRDVPVETARTDLFNLLDLAGCFVGADRSALRGHGLRSDFEDSDGPFVVLSSAAQGIGVLAWPLARAELTVLREQLPGAVAFNLPVRGQPHWWLPGQGASNSGVGEMRLLASLLLRDATSPEAQAMRATGRSDRGALAALRQLRRRLRERLVGAGLEIGPNDLTTRDAEGRFHLAADVPIIGVVSERRYRSSE